MYFLFHLISFLNWDTTNTQQDGGWFNYIHSFVFFFSCISYLIDYFLLSWFLSFSLLLASFVRYFKDNWLIFLVGRQSCFVCFSNTYFLASSSCFLFFYYFYSTLRSSCWKDSLVYSIELEREISDSKPTFRSIHSVSSELKIDCFKLKFTIVMAIASSCQGHRKRQPGTFFFCQVATGILCFIAATALGLEHSESMGKRIDRSVLLKSQRKADTKASFFRFAQAKMCGNGVCDRPIESLSNCPLDCSEHPAKTSPASSQKMVHLVEQFPPRDKLQDDEDLRLARQDFLQLHHGPVPDQLHDGYLFLHLRPHVLLLYLFLVQDFDRDHFPRLHVRRLLHLPERPFAKGLPYLILSNPSRFRFWGRRRRGLSFVRHNWYVREGRRG